MEFEGIRNYAVALFSFSVFFESFAAVIFVGSKERDRWGYVFALALMSMVNLYAGLEVWDNPLLGPAVITKMGFSASALVFTIVTILRVLRGGAS